MSSLYDSCLAVVAKNVCLVESFAGFPDIIGRQIFHAVEAASKFDLENPAESLCALSLFTTAYTDQVLSDVSMEGEHLSLANCMEHLMLFTHLRKINLASCCLGDAHELLYHISTLKRYYITGIGKNVGKDVYPPLTSPLFLLLGRKMYLTRPLFPVRT